MADGRALKEHIEKVSGAAFTESASGWKGRCPFEENSTSDSFLVFNSPEADFYCFGCKAKGGLADFDRLWGQAEVKRRRADLEAGILREARAEPSPAPRFASPQPGQPAQAPAQGSPDLNLRTSPPAGMDVSEIPAPSETSSSVRPLTRQSATAALVESLRSQLDYMQRQNEGLHGLVMKYNNMLIGSRQLLLESKEMFLEDSEAKHRLEIEVRVQQSKIQDLERQLDKWRIVKSEMESFIETLEDFTRKLRTDVFE